MARMQGSGFRPNWRHALALLLFAGLSALEVADGLERLATVRARRRGELLGLVDRQQEHLARRVAEVLGQGERHAEHLAKSPPVRALLSGGPAGELGAFLLPYLASFREVDSLRVLDGGGLERFRCERMGGGVAALPEGLLAPSPDLSLAELARRAEPGEVVVSPLSFDAARVEVAENDRWVFYLVAAVLDERADERLGTVAVTIYAAPLLHALQEFQPLPGTTSCVLDGAGELFAPLPGAPGEGAPAPGPRVEELLAGDPAARAELARGAGPVERPAAAYFARPTGLSRASLLVSAVPESALEADALGREGWRTALRSSAILLVIGLGTAFFVRAGERAQRLAQTESLLLRLREESAKNRALMEAAADMILIVEPSGELVVDWNPPAREVLGAAVSGASLSALAGALSQEDLGRVRALLRETAAGDGRPRHLAGIALAAGERVLEVDARAVAIDYGGRRLVELALSDRTREREMERRARTSERLSALGLLTAGVAHEVNNPLEGIANYLSLLERTEDPERREHYVAQVRRGFQRIREITGHLLHFARAEREGGAADLARVVERASKIAGFSKDLRGVELETRGLDAPLVVPGDEGRLEQVVLNLLLNAGRVQQGSGRILVSAETGDPRVVDLTVEDEGPGIAPEDLTRVFDPFFTRTGGTGLGLSVSHEIARAHGGELLATNRPRGGARFVLRLPRARIHEPEGDPDAPA